MSVEGICIPFRENSKIQTQIADKKCKAKQQIDLTID